MEYSEKIKKLKKMFSEGSMTVEASYIVPLVIGIVFAVMTVSFYFYDITTAHSVLNKNIEEFVNLPIHPYEEDSSFFEYASVNERFLLFFSEAYQNQENRGKENIKKEMERSLILLRMKSIDMKIKKGKVTAAAELSFPCVPFGVGFIPFFGKAVNIKEEKHIVNPADFARILTIPQKMAEKM